MDRQEPHMDCLSTDELAYHQRALAAAKAAQAAWQQWGTHLSEKYDLGPKDVIAEDGSILRAGSE